MFNGMLKNTGTNISHIIENMLKIHARDGKMVRQTFDSRGQTFDSKGESCFSERSEAKNSPEESKVCPRESKVPNHFSIPGKFNFSCSRIHFLAC